MKWHQAIFPANRTQSLACNQLISLQRQLLFLVSTLVVFLFSEAHAVFIGNELLGRPTPSSVTINACTDSVYQVYYEFGIDSTTFTRRTLTISCQDSIPFVTILDSLNANTRYYYRLRYRFDSTSQFLSHPIRHFRTANTNRSTFTFAIHADPHMDTASSVAVYTQTLQNTLNADPDFMIDLGDNFFCEKLPPYTQPRITQRHQYLRSFYDIAAHSVPLFLTLGNHEGEQGWRLNGTADCLPVMATNTRKSYFPNPEPDGFYSGDTTHEAFVGRREGYYSWEWGNALFVVLDLYWYPTQNPQQDLWRFTLGQTQYNWFANVLQNSQARFKFVFIHQLVGGNANDPRGGIESVPFFEQGGRNLDTTWGFSTHRPGWALPLHQLMVQNHVSALFHGHDHFYCKQDLDGIVYQLAPQPSNVNMSAANSAAGYGYVNGTILPTRGFLNVTVADTVCRVNYVRTYLPSEENATRHNGDIGDTYTIVHTDSGTASIFNESIIPNSAQLKQNYPNPFNSETNISFDLVKQQQVKLEIFTSTGQLVQRLIEESLPAGRYKIHYRPAHLASGTYYYRLTSGVQITTAKMILLK